ncbi:MAG: YfiM family protein [Flavobacterium sp. JAD_PAG50586_2]|nr:MAG: YfiM family protein [Flavobacterium sp. JAD_PAG50586_2]
MKVFKSILFVLLFWFSQTSSAQNAFERFLKPSDTLNKKRLNTLLISETAIGAATLIGLNQVWYADYPRSDFHFINDNAEWLQMDKAGHVFSAYHLGSIGANALKWTGASRKSQLIYGSTLGLAFLTTVEVFDGYSANWGASLGDVAANISGTALYVSQELLWKEQRIVPKFSFHTTPYASARPSVLGSSVQEQVLKDYNGQTYWLSANIHSFAKTSAIPKWLNVAVGYGAEGMITGNDEFVNTVFLPESERYRQFYLSLDVDLTKIETKSHFVKTILTVFNSIKIPAPTFEIKGLGGTKFHWLYF